MAKTQQRLELTTNTYKFTRTGIVITGKSSLDDWELMGEGLRAVDEARQWAIGDWLCDGKRHYGDGLYGKAAKLTGLNSNTLEQFASMSSRFENLCRHKDLSYEHHKQPASIKPIVEREDGTLALGDDPDHEKIAEFLQLAAPSDGDKKPKLSVSELRAKGTSQPRPHSGEIPTLDLTRESPSIRGIRDLSVAPTRSSDSERTNYRLLARDGVRKPLPEAVGSTFLGGGPQHARKGEYRPERIRRADRGERPTKIQSCSGS